MRLRSLLFAPGDSDRKIARALASAADVVILDLEDAVAATAKPAARAAVVTRLAAPASAVTVQAAIVVRVNPPHTAWYLADLAALVPCRPHAVMLPKCTGGPDLLALDHHLEALETVAGIEVGSIGVLPILTESAAAVLALPSCAPVPRRVRALCCGVEDLAADLGIAPRRPDGTWPAPVAQARGALLLAAAAAGLPALDTPYPDPRDAAGLVGEAAGAAADGFAGKLCIHPDQIAAVNAAFTPSAGQIAWARRVREGFAVHPGTGVFALDGQMIDRPHRQLAERILALAGE